MPLARFRITLAVGQPPTVEVNGQPLPPDLVVLGFGFDSGDGGVPVLTLDVAGEVNVEGEGIVRLRSGGTEDLRTLVESIDPAALQGLAEQNLSMLTLADSPALAWMRALAQVADVAAR